MSDPKISIPPDMLPSVWGKLLKNQLHSSTFTNLSRGPDSAEDSDGDKATLLSKFIFRLLVVLLQV